MGDNNNFTAQVTNNIARESIRPDFILSGNQNRQLVQSPDESDVIFLGNLGGENILAAKTIRFGTETIHPDGTSTTTGYMELPTKWGFNGMYLGIKGGRIDWIDPDETSADKFGFANFGTVSKNNNDFPNLVTLYNSYRNKSVVEEVSEQQSTGVLTNPLNDIRLSSTIGLYSNAGGFSSTAIGWENNVENNFSILLGTNLDLSSSIPINDICGGEIVLGTSNLKFDDRDFSHQYRILTIGNGDISNNADGSRSDAFFILKNGNSYFKNTLDICGSVHMWSDLNVDSNIKVQNIDSKYGISGENVIATNTFINNNSYLETIVARKNSGTYYENQSGSLRIGSERGIRFNMYKTGTESNNQLANHSDKQFTSKQLGENYIRTENTGGIQLYTTRASDDPTNNARNAYGTIQILHPDAYHSDNSNITGFSSEILEPPNINAPFRGTHITWYGISSEDVSFNKATIGGLNLPPTNQGGDPNQENDPPNPIDNKGLVLVNNGDGTCKWTDMRVNTVADVCLNQLKDTYIDREDKFLVIGKARSDIVNFDISGIKTKNLIILDNVDICKNTLIYGDLSVNGDFDVSGNTDICGNLDVCGNIDISGTLKLTGKGTIHNSLDLSGDLITDSIITTAGKITGTDGLEITGDVNITGDIDISGDIELSGNIDISSDLNVYGEVTRVEDLVIDKNIYLANIDKVTTDSKSYVNRSDGLTKGATPLLTLINNQIAATIGNMISNPAGSIIFMARDSESIPINYKLCNGQFVEKSQFDELYGVLPKNNKDILPTDKRHSKLLIEVHQQNAYKYPTVDSTPGSEGVTCGFQSVLYPKYYTDYFNLKGKIFSTVVDEDIRVELSGNSTTNIGNIRFTIIPVRHADSSKTFSYRNYSSQEYEKNVVRDQVGNMDLVFDAPSELQMIKTISWQDFSQNISSNGYYDISSAISNLDYNVYKHFKLHVEISDTNATSPQYEYIYKTDWGELGYGTNTNPAITLDNDTHRIYQNSKYNKYELYAAASEADLQTRYFKLPNIMNKFVRGGDENICSLYNDSLKNHTHQTMGHSHDIDEVLSATATTDQLAVQLNKDDHLPSVPTHKHTISSQKITNIDFQKFKDDYRTNEVGKKKISILCDDTEDLNESEFTHQNIPTDASGAIVFSTSTLTGNPLSVPISINMTVTGGEFSGARKNYEDISGILDMNKSNINNVSETAPEHTILLPCIAVGNNRSESSGDNLDNYSVLTRIEILQRRLDNLDICMNSGRLNIHSFIENPSGDGQTA